MLSERDQAIYEWQMDVPGLGITGQEKLRGATALVSRIGGVGGPLCLALAAAGIGRLIIAHGGNLKPSDLNASTCSREQLTQMGQQNDSRAAWARQRQHRARAASVVRER